MPYQVGTLCYASRLDAGAPACASFQPVNVLAGNQLTTIGCQSVNADGSLLMYRSVADTTNTVATVVTNFSQDLYYADCVQGDYLVAIESLAGPVLALAVACWGMWRLISYLGWGRADST